jgi:uncharacterized membrane-anchored protein
MKTKFLLLVLIASFVTMAVRAQDTNALPADLVKILNSLKYQQGEINLKDGLATLNVPKDFNFLGPDDAETVLVKLWGNPPSSDKPLGLLIPAGMTPASSNAWVVTIDYSEDGYVSDTNASSIDYTKLLQQMQQGVAEENKERQKQGYQTITLVGWAEPPHYDAATHKLYWAKDLKFGDDSSDTLNYCIRILGRRGVLELDAVSALGQLDEIHQQAPEILGMVDFKEGNRYADFDPKVDKVAKYGIAALVAGGVLGAAAKFGLLKLIWVGILAAKKFVIIGFLAVVAFFKKLFNRKSSNQSTPGS